MNYKKYRVLIPTFFFFVLLSLTSVAFFLSYSRYVNYVFGKFDLGNMNQMLYNSSRFNFMVLTDYFGSNNIRWSMSHIDPSILLLIPINWFFSDAIVLLIVQNLCFLFSSLLIFKIARLEGLSVINSWLISIILYVFPMSGFILVWTTFHPTVLSLPIYFLIYYLFLLNREKKLPKYINRKYFVLLVIVFTVLFILGKEELGLIFSFSAPLLINKFSKEKKLILKLAVFSFIWSLICLAIIIPAYSSARNLSTQNFIREAKISIDVDKFSNANYFLYRYSELGDSYGEIAKSILLNPESFINILISKSNIATLIQILLPNLFLILMNPYLIVAFVPETLIQMLSADPEVFSITNHRLIVVLPILILAYIYSGKYLEKHLKKLSYLFFVVVILLNVTLSVQYKSPFIFPLTDRLYKVITFNPTTIYADSSGKNIEFKNDISRTCPDFLISKISENDAVSVPQPLGARTSNRKFNALFPTGIKSSNVIISDIYDRKIVDFLKIPETVNKKIVKHAIDNEQFSLEYSCDRFFLLRKNYSRENIGSVTLLDSKSFQKKEENKLLKNSYFDSANIKTSNNLISFDYKYFLGDESSRNALFNYSILTNGKDSWQFVHFPSFYLTPLDDIPVNSYVQEKFILPIPDFLPKGKYSIYFGMGDKKENNNNLKVAELSF